MKRRRVFTGRRAKEAESSNCPAAVTVRSRRGGRRGTQDIPAVTPPAAVVTAQEPEQRTVTLWYVIHPKRTTERKAWTQRQDPKDKNAHLYSRLFVNKDRELYFAEFDGHGGVSMMCWLVDTQKRRMRVKEDAYRLALERKPPLGGHQFYQRCDGAWRVKDLCLDTRCSGRRR